MPLKISAGLRLFVERLCKQRQVIGCDLGIIFIIKYRFSKVSLRFAYRHLLSVKFGG